MLLGGVIQGTIFGNIAVIVAGFDKTQAQARSAPTPLLSAEPTDTCI